MDKKAIARRSDALNADGVRYHRRDLCDMIAYREADIKQLKEENKELRKLVEDIYKAFMHGNCYRWCGFEEPCNYILDCKCQLYDRMRKLGFEVPDD